MSKKVKTWLKELADSNKSTGKDSKAMENLLRRLEFGKAKVVGGLVYLEGKGKPTSINKVAEKILEKVEE